jgi:AcrR family transcriptional regulator
MARTRTFLLTIWSPSVATPDSGPESEDRDAPRPLSGGRHSFDPEIVAHNQRERLLGALISVVAEHGYAASKVTEIADDASVSLRSFYENFADKEACFLAAYEALDAYIATIIDAAVEDAPDDWAERAAAAFAALIGFLSERPNFARIYLVESFVVGDALAPAREKAAGRLRGLLEPGRKVRDSAPGLPEGIEEGLVGGIFTLLARRVLGGEAATLARYTPAVIDFTLSPFLGPETAGALAGRYAPASD